MCAGSTDVEIPTVVSGLLAGGTGLARGAGTGPAIGLLTYAGMKIWRAYRENVDHPYQYSSRVEKMGASLVLPPAGRKAA